MKNSNCRRAVAVAGDAGATRRLIALLTALTAAVLLASCANDPVATIIRIATSISISPTAASLDALGATQSFQVTVRDQNGDVMNGQSIDWSTQSTQIAGVSATGVATAVSNGSTQVVATVGSLEARVALTVQQQVSTLTKISGDNQQATVGTQLPQQLRVRVLDRLGSPIQGMQVHFVMSANGGEISVFNGLSNADGDVETTWTLGTLAAAHTVTASVNGVEGATAVFGANAAAGPPASLQKVTGDGQMAMVGTLLAALPTVRVVDAHGNAVAGASVAFQVVDGGGSVSGAPPSTNESGLAFPATWQLGSAPGLNVLRVTSPSLPAADFSATAIIGPPALTSAHQGNGQSAPIATNVPVVPGIRVTDMLGNPIPGFPVSFAVSSGGGSITGASVSSDANGVALLGSWTLGVVPGANQIVAAAGSLASVQFNATGTAVPANVAVFAGNNQTADAGTNVPTIPAVLVTTAQGHPAPGIQVAFQVQIGGGSVGQLSAITDANGVASALHWTLGTVAGINTLAASVAGLNLVIFTGTGIPGPVATVVKHAGDNQSAATTTAVAVAPAVRVTDQFGNNIVGASVSFTVTGGGGSATGSPATTNGIGVATAGSWTLGPTQGLNQLAAQTGALPAVTFNATGTAIPVTMVIFAGGSQSATVGSQVSTPPAVRVLDAGFAPVQGVSVTFAVIAGGGSFGGSAVVSTDANGVAAVSSWTLGTVAGTNTLEATAPTLGPIQINATGMPGAAASIAAFGGDNQSVVAGTQVPVAPAAIVRDGFANPVSGVEVTFAITAGGGTIQSPLAVTNASGVAAVGSWTVGAGINTLSATATPGGIAGNPASFTATGTVSAFNIELRYLTGVSPAQQTAFTNAVSKWQAIITGDIPSISLNVGAGDCGANSPAMSETVDDLVIFVTLEPIDGAGSILGSAGPCRVRTGSWLPITGRMRFDVADLATMEASGILEGVILHEMGHVLGVGTLWSLNEMLVNPSLPSSPGVDTHFNGANAIAAFNTIGGAAYADAKVPVENTQGGSGTRDAHWRESVFDNELMTGFIGAGSNPLSLVTIRSLQDLGYTVNVDAAEAYLLPDGGAVMDHGPRFHLFGDVNSEPVKIGGGGG
jgi:adhesin/invasin